LAWYQAWKPYVPVAKRRARAAAVAAKLAKKENRPLCPVKASGRTMSQSFWGQAWCQNLERYSDFANRLPRGRTYARNGSVIDLQIECGKVQALVSGSEIYRVSIAIKTLSRLTWKRIRQDCSQSIDSLLELLQGRFDQGVMQRLTQRDGGLFPRPTEIEMDCSCPDWAGLCKHVAAAMYCVGTRLDAAPELLFTLRDVDHLELIGQAVAAENLDRTLAAERGSTLAESNLGELFGFELALLIERARSARRNGIALDAREKLSRRLIQDLPFALTGGQAGAIEEIGADLARPSQMNRMLMGDVGSGKTLVAFWAMLRAVECGYQAAMMAPTELLAEQHYRSFQRMCGKLGLKSALLTGRIAGAERRSILREIASGELPIVFGTHALIQERVHFRELALGVIDEQHRFGVFDRAKMKALGARVNLLMMTATPIPRSLAMSLFANLDVSFLDEMPPGRTPIATEIYAEDDLAQVHELLRGEIRNRGRAYYVVPFIEGEDDEAKSVSATATRIAKGVLRDARIGTMHGRMAGAEKDRVMRAFRDGALDILVSTTVVEVGIDVPEATVIAIDAAERYGLAQLHQLRGRVGRGDKPSRCCLIASRDSDPASCERLEVMRECTTGKSVAEADLRMRGPGDLLGARQTGALPLRFVHLVRDLETVERARRIAEDWLKRDPKLASAASAGARDALQKMLALGFSLGDVG
jgi:ATP-dependent DNA helicase RecG